ncbi:unnamed protein product, partial [Iphiclides podalirius]
MPTHELYPKLTFNLTSSAFDEAFIAYTPKTTVRQRRRQRTGSRPIATHNFSSAAAAEVSEWLRSWT